MLTLPTTRLGLIVPAIIAALLWLASPASAQTTTTENHLALLNLNELFIELKAAPGEAEANNIASYIWHRWTVPEEPELAEMMTRVLIARRLSNFERTVSLLDQMITTYPNYAEGWNQRATVHFLLGDYEKSLADIAETLAREPRHFGALSGRAMIYLRIGKQVEALKSVVEALQYHPYLAERGLFRQLLKPTTQT